MTPQSLEPLKGMPTLLVEDDPVSAWLLFGLLADAGCEVQMAASAEEAFITLRTFRPRLMVLDLVLPRMGGLMLARHLTHAAASRDIVIIAVSAMDAALTERLALEAGCQAFIPKPIDPFMFAQTVARHLADAVCQTN